ncbi:MAG TPA: hypothetical protein VK459_21360 [Polyangiaceae bacterium]|jgi:hypothetical protein|nr:hypothetical protein [Polyangiaceae bacterium]
MKVVAILFVTALSFGLLGCPEAPKAEPTKDSVKPTTSAAPATTPASTKKTEDQGSGW